MEKLESSFMMRIDELLTKVQVAIDKIEGVATSLTLHTDDTEQEKQSSHNMDCKEQQIGTTYVAVDEKGHFEVAQIAPAEIDVDHVVGHEQIDQIRVNNVADDGLDDGLSHEKVDELEKESVHEIVSNVADGFDDGLGHEATEEQEIESVHEIVSHVALALVT